MSHRTTYPCWSRGALEEETELKIPQGQDWGVALEMSIIVPCPLPPPGSHSCAHTQPCLPSRQLMGSDRQEAPWPRLCPLPRPSPHPSPLPEDSPPSGAPTYRIPLIAFAPLVARGAHFPLQRKRDEEGPPPLSPPPSPAPLSPRPLTLSPSSPEGPAAPGGPGSPSGPGTPSWPVEPGGPRSP